jgi:hypothetical protein
VESNQDLLLGAAPLLGMHQQGQFHPGIRSWYHWNADRAMRLSRMPGSVMLVNQAGPAAALTQRKPR